MQGPGIGKRGCDIVASMHDGARNAFEFSGLREELVVARKKAAMHEVVALDAREGEGEAILPELRNSRRIGTERDRACLPLAPGPGAVELHSLVTTRKPLIIG